MAYNAALFSLFVCIAILCFLDKSEQVMVRFPPKMLPGIPYYGVISSNRTQQQQTGRNRTSAVNRLQLKPAVPKNVQFNGNLSKPRPAILPKTPKILPANRTFMRGKLNLPVKPPHVIKSRSVDSTETNNNVAPKTLPKMSNLLAPKKQPQKSPPNYQTLVLDTEKKDGETFVWIYPWLQATQKRLAALSAPFMNFWGRNNPPKEEVKKEKSARSSDSKKSSKKTVEISLEDVLANITPEEISQLLLEESKKSSVKLESDTAERIQIPFETTTVKPLKVVKKKKVQSDKGRPKFPIEDILAYLNSDDISLQLIEELIKMQKQKKTVGKTMKFLVDNIRTEDLNPMVLKELQKSIILKREEAKKKMLKVFPAAELINGSTYVRVTQERNYIPVIMVKGDRVIYPFEYTTERNDLNLVIPSSPKPEVVTEEINDVKYTPVYLQMNNTVNIEMDVQNISSTTVPSIVDSELSQNVTQSEVEVNTLVNNNATANGGDVKLEMNTVGESDNNENKIDDKVREVEKYEANATKIAENTGKLSNNVVVSTTGTVVNATIENMDEFMIGNETVNVTENVEENEISSKTDSSVNSERNHANASLAEGLANNETADSAMNQNKTAEEYLKEELESKRTVMTEKQLDVIRVEGKQFSAERAEVPTDGVIQQEVVKINESFSPVRKTVASSADDHVSTTMETATKHDNKDESSEAVRVVLSVLNNTTDDVSTTTENAPKDDNKGGSVEALREANQILQNEIIELAYANELKHSVQVITPEKYAGQPPKAYRPEVLHRLSTFIDPYAESPQELRPVFKRAKISEPPYFYNPEVTEVPTTTETVMVKNESNRMEFAIDYADNKNASTGNTSVTLDSKVVEELNAIDEILTLNSSAPMMEFVDEIMPKNESVKTPESEIVYANATQPEETLFIVYANSVSEPEATKVKNQATKVKDQATSESVQVEVMQAAPENVKFVRESIEQRRRKFNMYLEEKEKMEMEKRLKEEKKKQVVVKRKQSIPEPTKRSTVLTGRIKGAEEGDEAAKIKFLIEIPDELLEGADAADAKRNEESQEELEDEEKNEVRKKKHEEESYQKEKAAEKTKTSEKFQQNSAPGDLPLYPPADQVPSRFGPPLYPPADELQVPLYRFQQHFGKSVPTQQHERIQHDPNSKLNPSHPYHFHGPQPRAEPQKQQDFNQREHIPRQQIQNYGQHQKNLNFYGQPRRMEQPVHLPQHGHLPIFQQGQAESLVPANRHLEGQQQYSVPELAIQRENFLQVPQVTDGFQFQQSFFHQAVQGYDGTPAAREQQQRFGNVEAAAREQHQQNFQRESAAAREQQIQQQFDGTVQQNYERATAEARQQQAQQHFEGAVQQQQNYERASAEARQQQAQQHFDSVRQQQAQQQFQGAAVNQQQHFVVPYPEGFVREELVPIVVV